jgi:(p)ppGpp synthase/HD superfamily hydrolase
MASTADRSPLADRLPTVLRVDGNERMLEIIIWVVASLANRLGIWRVKSELQDLGFRYTDAGSYRELDSLSQEIPRLLAMPRPERTAHA